MLDVEKQRQRRRGIEIKREMLTQLAESESRKLRQAHGPFCFCAKLSKVPTPLPGRWI